MERGRLETALDAGLTGYSRACCLLLAASSTDVRRRRGATIAVEGDPLDDPAAVTRVVAVMTRGLLLGPDGAPASD